MTATHVLCDLTQSYAANGGGIRTYLTEKRSFIDRHTPHTHLLIVPGAEDRASRQGRHITVEIASPKISASPNYRFLLRSHAVLRALREYRPTTIECLCAYNLPWTAIWHRRQAPETSLIAGYRTDFPTVYVEEYAKKIFGHWSAPKFRRLAYAYARKLYGKFDGVYALNSGMAETLGKGGSKEIDVLPLGIDPVQFNPNRRDDGWRSSIGAAPGDPVLVYAGRIDEEKEADVVFDAFSKLPDEMNAHLVMLGDGNLLNRLRQAGDGKRIHFPGFIGDRAQLGRILASSDIYVSAMAFETFGISIIEAQAAGLPVVGVNAGAMPDRVSPGLGILGPVGDAEAMAANIAKIWSTGEARQMGAQAYDHANTQYSWQRTFEHLFGHIYPKASGLQFLGDISAQTAGAGTPVGEEAEPNLTRPIFGG